jgi:hydrogenase maturation protein HypF
MFKIGYPFKKEILACGSEKLAGFCLTKKNCGYVINNLGSLNEQEVFENYQKQIKHFQAELKINPKIITHDLHPEYNSTKYAQSLIEKSKRLKCVAIQHHHAHIASCIGENGIRDKVIGVVFDSAGYGEDHNIWGGEFFVGDVQGFQRFAYLKYVPFSNNQQSVPDAWQQAASYLYQAFGESFLDLDIDFMRSRSMDNWLSWQQNLANCPLSSSVSGLFDAVSALVGLSNKLEYEGQGVHELERIVNRSSHVAGKIYEFTLKKDKDKYLIYPESIVQSIVEDLKKNISKSIISAVFHNTIVEIVKSICHKIRKKEKIKNVILTGSVFQNKLLLNRLKNVLTEDEFTVIDHRHFPCNDSNIAFGQAVLANVI